LIRLEEFLILTELWKKELFPSPKFSHLFLDFYLRKFSYAFKTENEVM
jgi:hypothetical protein